MNYRRLSYWVVTIAMCALFLYSAQMYFFNLEMVKGYFASLIFPTWVVLPLAVAKVLGVIAVITDKSALLREWAYAGFFFDVILATFAHHYAGHGIIGLSALGIFLVIASRYLYSFRLIPNE